MRRREALVAVASLLGGGCLAGRDGDDGGDTPTPEPTPTDRPETSETERPPGPTNYHPARTVETYQVGPAENRGDHHHLIRVWNATETDQEVVVSLVNAETREAVVDDSPTLPADTDLAIDVYAPADYRLTVRFTGLDAEVELSVDSGMVDCNDSVTSIVALPDGRLDHTTFSTAVACLTGTPLTGTETAEDEG